MTPYIQQIDDNVGRAFRNLGYDFLDDWHADAIEKVNALHGADASSDLITAALTLSSKGLRELLVKSIQKAAEVWSSDPAKYKTMAAKAALRTGLAMRVDCFDGVRPVRFPEDYPTSIHPASGAPVIVLDPPIVEASIQPAPTEFNVDVVNTVGNLQAAVGPRGHLVGGITIVDNIARVNITLTLAEPLGPTPSAAPIIEEVDIDDGWSDEEERIFLADELSASSASSDSEDSSDGEGDAQYRTRRRWCLTGCDCERVRGRKCGCERRGRLRCSKNCGCDPQHCRARGAPVDSDDEC